MDQLRGYQFFEMMRNRGLRNGELSHQGLARNLVMMSDGRKDGEPLGVRDRLSDSLLLTFGQLNLRGSHSPNLGILEVACQHRSQKKRLSILVSCRGLGAAADGWRSSVVVVGDRASPGGVLRS